jgi:hypothetical protein
MVSCIGERFLYPAGLSPMGFVYTELASALFFRRGPPIPVMTVTF